MLVVDGHCDTLLELFKNKSPFWQTNSTGHLDWLRLQKGGVGLQFMAIYIEPQYKPYGALCRVLEILDYYQQLQSNGESHKQEHKQEQKQKNKLETKQEAKQKNEEQVQLLTVTTKIDLQALSSQSPRILLSIEGGEVLEGKLSTLRVLFRLGFRSLTLTWNQRNELGDGAWETDTRGGLTTFGREVVREMHKLGMLVDVSHLAEAGFWDVLSLSEKPVAATHSCCAALYKHPRNLTDAQLAALQKNKGIVGINFYPGFLGENKVSIEEVVKHIEHAVSVAGVAQVGLGSDFDGIDQVPQGLEDVTKYPCLIEKLLQRNWNEDDVKKIIGGNYIRVLERVLPAE